MTRTGRWFVLALVAVLAALAGCAQPREATVEPPPAPPLVMDPASIEQARQWYAQWAGEPPIAGDADVRHAFVIGKSAPSGRAGHSLLACRLVLLDGDYRPIRHDGPIRIVLVAGPHRPDPQVVGGWQFDTAEAARHFLYGMMPGYQLDLVWPRVAGADTYRLVVRWSDRQGRAHATSTFHFEDVFGHDVQTTSPAS